MSLGPGWSRRELTRRDGAVGDSVSGGQPRDPGAAAGARGDRCVLGGAQSEPRIELPPEVIVVNLRGLDLTVEPDAILAMAHIMRCISDSPDGTPESALAQRLMS
jgi:hypothetical protein